MTICKTVELTRGYSAVVDADDWDLVSQFKWRACVKKHTVYAIAWTPMRNGVRKLIKLHRLVMNAPDGVEVDHRDRDGLNCTKENLRLCTHSQNMRNRRGFGKHGAKGVKYTAAKKWEASITSNGSKMYLGTFQTKEAAASAYGLAATVLAGEFACTQATPGT